MSQVMSQTSPGSQPSSPLPPPQDGAPVERPHIALVGLMGAGKSAVGRLLAQAVNMDFVDLDEVIARTAKKPIPDIFREHGEVAFRAAERAALRQVLAAGRPTVLATGGGTFADPAARQSIDAVARTIYLKASPAALLARLGTHDARASRPLLDGPDPLTVLTRLLDQRAGAYE
ncbi:MAG TPA: shikimate kinase, partial [Myxococcota bacterium]|nr:shikimate kinase [Myxococcota bacterium]